MNFGTELSFSIWVSLVLEARFNNDLLTQSSPDSHKVFREVENVGLSFRDPRNQAWTSYAPDADQARTPFALEQRKKQICKFPVEQVKQCKRYSGFQIL